MEDFYSGHNRGARVVVSIKLSVEICDRGNVQIKQVNNGGHCLGSGAENGDLTSWFFVDPKAELCSVKFIVVQSGEDVPMDYMYAGSENGFHVWADYNAD